MPLRSIQLDRHQEAGPMESNQKPTAERMRPFLQAMERSIDSARQRRTNSAPLTRPQPAVSGASSQFDASVSGMQVGQRRPSQALVGVPRPHPSQVGTPSVTPSGQPSLVLSPETTAGETPGKLKARRKDADPPVHSAHQPQRKAV
jgi:hypothetical protein